LLIIFNLPGGFIIGVEFGPHFLELSTSVPFPFCGIIILSALAFLEPPFLETTLLCMVRLSSVGRDLGMSQLIAS